MPYPAITSALLLLASSGAPTLVQDVAIFEPAPITENLSVTAYGIIKDSRCADFGFCSAQDALVVAVVVLDHGQRRGVQLELGEPIQVSGGTLTLASTPTAPSDNGAIPLKDYVLNYTFIPSR